MNSTYLCFYKPDEPIQGFVIILFKIYKVVKLLISTSKVELNSKVRN